MISNGHKNLTSSNINVLLLVFIVKIFVSFVV